MSFPKELSSHGFTSFASNQSIAFALKLFLDELPVQNILIRHFPNAFEHYPLCLLCHNAPESLDHVRSCSFWLAPTASDCSNLRSYTSIVLKVLHHAKPFV